MTNSVSVEERFWSIVDPNGVPSDMWEALDILARSYRKDRQSSEREEKLRALVEEAFLEGYSLGGTPRDAGRSWELSESRQALEATNG